MRNLVGKFKKTLAKISRVSAPAIVAGGLLLGTAKYAKAAERELTPAEQQLTNWLIKTGEKHGLTDRATWQILNYDSSEIKNNINNAESNASKKFWQNALDLQRELKEQGFLDSLGKAVHLIPEDKRDSIKAWSQEFKKKTGTQLDSNLLKKMLRSSQYNVQTQIDSLQKTGSSTDSLRGKIMKKMLKNGIYDRYFETPDSEQQRLYRLYLEPKYKNKIRNLKKIGTQI
ncbi:Uncharacterised protein [uncultured archaeon]|nr:Uncharacterised protein [uncultured archaeon]